VHILTILCLFTPKFRFMPVTALDKKTALVLIDLQNGIVSRPVVPNSAAEVIANAAILAAAFRAAKLPVVVVNVIPAERHASMRNDVKMSFGQLPPDWAEIVPQIGVQSGDVRITKHTWNAFYNTHLNDELKKRGVTGIVLAGVSTSIGVEGTARAAYERGYNITFAEDAMTDMNEKSHINSLTAIFPRIGEVGTTYAIIQALQQNS
jgi:nicotinamidase-related amidase